MTRSTFGIGVVSLALFAGASFWLFADNGIITTDETKRESASNGVHLFRGQVASTPQQGVSTLTNRTGSGTNPLRYREPAAGGVLVSAGVQSPVAPQPLPQRLPSMPVNQGAITQAAVTQSAVTQAALQMETDAPSSSAFERPGFSAPSDPTAGFDAGALFDADVADARSVAAPHPLPVSPQRLEVASAPAFPAPASNNLAFDSAFDSVTADATNAEITKVEPAPASPFAAADSSQQTVPKVVAKSPTPLTSADPFAAGVNVNDAAPVHIQTPLQTEIHPKQSSASENEQIAIAPKNAVRSNPPVKQVQETLVSQNSEGTGLPGLATQDGPQTPHLTVEKVLPAEVIIDQPTTIKTILKNVGNTAIRSIVLRDKVPQGATLLSTAPEIQVNHVGDLVWNLGDLEANEQIIVEMRILPIKEGEIGSVAAVNYTAEASARINVTRPLLRVEVKAPAEIKLGQQANFEITISNPGTATATGVVLEEYVPDGLFHKDGKILVNRNIDTLKPKQVKRLPLTLTCTGSGELVNRVVVRANGNLMVEQTTAISALAPILKLEIAGPKQNFLERQAKYRLVVANSGTAAAENVDLVATLPPAMKFVKTNQSGVYEPSTHSVHWALEELPAQEAGEIELELLPAQTGTHAIRFTGNGQANLKSETTHPVAIDGLSALAFEVVGESNLVEVGKETFYEIRVANRGTKNATNVRVQADLPDGMTFVKAEGPVRYQANNGIVQFENLTQLEAKGEKIYRIAAKCMTDGDHRVRVQVVSDDLKSPISKEESTRVFQ
ncbi:MAG: hypothetical protein ACRCUY_08400 [Thermoguttaceae bacterium]